MKNRMRQQGVTLVELMIAMLVSLVLAAGVGTVYLSSKRNYQARDQLSMMNENARVALETLQQHLEHAGYATAAKLPLPGGNYFYVNGDSTTAPVAFICGGLGEANVRDVNDFNSRGTQDAFNTFGDAISIRFLGDDNLFADAAGGVLPGGASDNCRVEKSTNIQASFIYNAFHVDTDGNTKNSLNEWVPILYAVGSNVNNRQPIVNGIENLQFMYGIDGNLDGTADYFLNATDTTSGALWRRVISIKVAILVRSLEPVLETATASSYKLLDKTVNITTPDRYQRRVYTTVIQLRNVVDG
ncbi:MAG: PilW family protein [Thiothrix sp.]|uniref:PilW family protein n=1 Tax=Thiothrix sp. TaxID=1032 RepID=UPI002613A621|nr:PilW family protein [Thiothrix sp.]MDD5393758.1 PilW family protein [Thiothrix sp.]